MLSRFAQHQTSSQHPFPTASRTPNVHVPKHFHSPFKLAFRLLKSRKKEAYHAMATAAGGLLASPLDWMLRPLEDRLYRNAPQPQGPILIVVGPPRSGTTLVAQTLIRHLRSNYLNNLTSLFPSAPITANRLLPRNIRPEQVTTQSFYGRTAKLSGHNDALYLWDRWLGSDRTRVIQDLSEEKKDQMRRFFGAFQDHFPGPLVIKNNNLNVCASLIGNILPTAHFVCLHRDQDDLTRSLLVARNTIHGDQRLPYGIGPAGFEKLHPLDSIQAQIEFLEGLAQEQQNKLGPHRFWPLAYEDFCSRPAHWVRTFANRLGILLPNEACADLQPFERHRHLRINTAPSRSAANKLPSVHTSPSRRVRNHVSAEGQNGNLAQPDLREERRS